MKSGVAVAVAAAGGIATEASLSRLRIGDDDGDPLPAGEPGVIMLRGDVVLRPRYP
jgi:non-ribosomal peptide synthetase component E (peptide arylation enzyme)